MYCSIVSHTPVTAKTNLFCSLYSTTVQLNRYHIPDFQQLSFTVLSELAMWSHYAALISVCVTLEPSTSLHCVILHWTSEKIIIVVFC